MFSSSTLGTYNVLQVIQTYFLNKHVSAHIFLTQIDLGIIKTTLENTCSSDETYMNRTFDKTSSLFRDNIKHFFKINTNIKPRQQHEM